ncbi:hypothetical protein NHP190012_04200 [Helicobacter sp. NHP19-012]|uniref:Methyl-accepting chemotaxis protein n=1 Tax=Helicobacter gastrofelis TaxID=2849642 RepID=A0ABM7SMI3_9HELI|nr:MULTISPECIES: hypothetical protein [unclassified Helicobacter]BCZ18778.1 hypothetical protein NHP190012_04200 [Helicobacter sp. NHP19-012]GMB96192.1 hypothetical protein NHP22001_07810 [Helicobacter sp. NHP22-001]
MQQRLEEIQSAFSSMNGAVKNIEGASKAVLDSLNENNASLGELSKVMATLGTQSQQMKNIA